MTTNRKEKEQKKETSCVQPHGEGDEAWNVEGKCKQSVCLSLPIDSMYTWTYFCSRNKRRVIILGKALIRGTIKLIVSDISSWLYVYMNLLSTMRKILCPCRRSVHSFPLEQFNLIGSAWSSDRIIIVHNPSCFIQWEKWFWVISYLTKKVMSTSAITMTIKLVIWFLLPNDLSLFCRSCLIRWVTFFVLFPPSLSSHPFKGNFSWSEQ